MASQKKQLSINDLQPGMICAADITFKGMVLISEGVLITESIIMKLKGNYIVDKVEVFFEDVSQESSINEIKTSKELDNTFNEFSTNLEIIFNSLTKSSISGIDEIRTFSKKIQEEFKSTGMVIRNIVFYGNSDASIYRHSVNVAAISFILGKWLGLDEREINFLTYSAVLHDLGKVKIDDNILNKDITALSPQEYQIYKNHPVLAYDLIKKIPYLDSSVGQGVLMHHERMDGSGYPFGLKEDKIHKFAKIIAIADLFDEVSSNKYHKKVNGPFDALRVIQEESLGKFDCKFCSMFLNHVVNYYMGENVLLNNDHSCKVIQVNINDLTNPLLLDDNGFLDLKKEKDLHVKKLVI